LGKGVGDGGGVAGSDVGHSAALSGVKTSFRVSPPARLQPVAATATAKQISIPKGRLRTIQRCFFIAISSIVKPPAG
jgi:hypothetical protein